MAYLYTNPYSSRQPYHRHSDPVQSHNPLPHHHPHHHHHHHHHHPQQQQQPLHHHHHHQQQPYSPINPGALVYPSQLMNPSIPSEDHPDPAPVKPHDPPPPAPKPETKPQATFLTKLYALLERPENHPMIRWDPAGEHIIVERPEQLALHVLPSIYRQSRFASFSRQLNIYGFMRKVNLRNVDPAIDDPDASTWSHPTLNRHSPPEVVANFKRRVPPRLPKPRKRESQDSQSVPPRTTVPMSAAASQSLPNALSQKASPLSIGRTRGFSAPGTFPPLGQTNGTTTAGAAAAAAAAGWGASYPRSALPPLTVPSEPHLSHANALYSQSPHAIATSSSEDSPGSSQFSSLAYNSNRDMLVSSSQYSYSDQGNWSSNFSSNPSPSGGHSGSLSSLLNPSSTGYPTRPTPSISTSYASPFSSVPMHSDHSASPDSRPTTGYSISSVSSIPYDDGSSPHHHLHHDYSRPSSSHRPISPVRPQSSKSSLGNGATSTGSSLSIRRARRHSQAMSPYPSPYDHATTTATAPTEQRPSTSPNPVDSHHGSIPRVRSMIQLPSVEAYAFNPSQAEFAYSALPTDPLVDGGNGWNSGSGGHPLPQPHHANRNHRPSTAASSISAASHTSSSQANTPPLGESCGNGETDINRFSPDFGFVPMNEHLPPYTKATVTEL